MASGKFRVHSRKPADVQLEIVANAQGRNASYSNNVGFYHYGFPVLYPDTGLGAPVPSKPGRYHT
jgi:hypothetical protein